ncbi:MAG: hypothetical protein IPP99_14025 [Chitinophagaceae bacterium]|nr:hypothetical protein [Chitinophagaceae bacterium]MBP6589380.1 hypothetical protein [Chitinophagaceae bacterium]
MKPRSMTPMGSLHPVLFFAGIYVVALLFSIFICSTLFYSCNASSANPTGQQQNPPPGMQHSGNPVASR